MAHICRVCDKEGAKRCGKCHDAYYCSVECQKTDWKEHKKFCKPREELTRAPSTNKTYNNQKTDEAKRIFPEPFTLDKFIPYVSRIKTVTKQCADMWVGLRMCGKMPVDSSLPTCFVYFTSKGYVREHMVMFQGPPPINMLQKIIDSYDAHAVSISVEIRYRNPTTLAVLKEGVLLQVSANGYVKKFFFDQAQGGRSDTGVLLTVSDPIECSISLFDSALVKFH